MYVASKWVRSQKQWWALVPDDRTLPRRAGERDLGEGNVRADYAGRRVSECECRTAEGESECEGEKGGVRIQKRYTHPCTGYGGMKLSVGDGAAKAGRGGTLQALLFPTSNPASASIMVQTGLGMAIIRI